MAHYGNNGKRREPRSLVRSSWRAEAFWRPAPQKKGVTLVTEWRK